MSPFQGLKGVFGAFTQGVALGYVILPLQGYKRLRTIFIAYGGIVGFGYEEVNL